MIKTLISVSCLTLVAACGGDSEQNYQQKVDAVNSQTTQYIRGGVEVKETQRDYRNWSTVALTTDLELLAASKDSEERVSPLSVGRSFCTGTLVHPRVVVSAAHCVRKMDRKTGKFSKELSMEPENFVISFDNRVSEDGNWVRAEAVYAAERWNSETTTTPSPKAPPHDIAVIILEDDAPDNARPIPIADKKIKIGEGDMIYAVGYGVSNSRKKNDTGILRQVNTPIRLVDSKAWRISAKGATSFGDQGGEKKEQEDNSRDEGSDYDEGEIGSGNGSSAGENEGIDAGEGDKAGSGGGMGGFGDIITEWFGGKGICGGDSGGPAYMLVNGKLRLFGAASIGLDLLGMKCLGHGTYTDVRYYKSWIYKVAAKHNIDMGNGTPGPSGNNNKDKKDKVEKPVNKAQWTLACKNDDGIAFKLEKLSKSRAIMTPVEKGAIGSALDMTMRAPKDPDSDAINAFTFTTEGGDDSVRVWIPGVNFNEDISDDIVVKWVKDSFSENTKIVKFIAGECKLR